MTNAPYSRKSILHAYHYGLTGSAFKHAMEMIPMPTTRKIPIRTLNAFIGSRIRTLRKAHNLTQEDLSSHLGVTPQQISKYENGYNSLSLTALYQVSCYFNVPINTFFPQSTQQSDPPPFDGDLNPASSLA